MTPSQLNGLVLVDAAKAGVSPSGDGPPVAVAFGHGSVPPPPQLKLLTVLRFFAAAWVLVFHLQAMFQVALPAPLSHLANNGAYAMSFFFVLSGTVLSYSYFGLGTGGAAVKRFYLARLSRIYPVYALVHLVGLYWLPIPTSDFARWAYVNATSILGVQAWFPLANTGVNSGSWSISCEFFFYLLFPALLPLIRNLATGAQLSRAAYGLSAFIGFLGLADFAFARQGAFPLFYISPLFRLAEFVLGMVIGVALARRPAGRRTPAWTVAAAGILVVITGSNQAYEVGMWTRANLIVVPALGWFIYSAAAYELSVPDEFNGSLWRGLQYLGRASYCMFLVQMPILLWLSTAYQTKNRLALAIASEPESSFILLAVVVVLLGIALHEAVEKPARRLIQRRMVA